MLYHLLMKIIKINFDGCCDNNSKFKFMGVGVATFVENVYEPKFDRYELVGTNGTSNIAEWSALTLALEESVKAVVEYYKGDVSIRIYGDSQLIVNQFNGEFQIKHEAFRTFYKRCKDKYILFGKYIKGVHWIPREQNKEADVLSKRAVTEFLVENKML